MEVRIFRAGKSAMQSGRAYAGQWRLEYEPLEPEVPNPLMGWAASGDTRRQVQLHFATREEAIAFARRNGLAWTAEESPETQTARPKSYAANFAADRKVPWTH